MIEVVPWMRRAEGLEPVARLRRSTGTGHAATVR